MKFFLLGISTLLISSCAATATEHTICEVVKNPAKYIGKEITIQDIVLADGHGDPFFVPDSKCPTYLSVSVSFHELPPSAKRDFTDGVQRLNRSEGKTLGLSGTYKMRAMPQSEPANLEVSLLEANNMHPADAADKVRSMDKHTPPEPKR